MLLNFVIVVVYSCVRDFGQRSAGLGASVPRARGLRLLVMG